MELITGRSNPLLKQIRSLRQSKGRRESGLFLVEGIHHVGAAVETGWDLETLVCAPDLLTSDFARELIQNQATRGVRCTALGGELFAGLAEKDNPQGIMAIVRQRHRTLEQVPVEAFRFGAACVSPQDPGNVGAILRTLDAVGADGLFLLDGGADLYHPSAVRASMGALFRIPVVQAAFADFAAWARAHACHLIGSSAHARLDYRELKNETRPVVLLLGSEQKGLSREQMEACDEMVSLPMKGKVSSLNLAVAAGILLYALLEKK